MAERSIHLETLLKLQSALEMFDMSFSTSNKLFRLALVSELIDTAGLFEQLAEDWKVNLPFGEGPDLDVDFEYWSDFHAWENLHMRATQNECIEGFPISLGNGRTSENAKRFKKSTYTKYLSSIFKSTRYEGKDTATDFLKFLMDDKTGTTRFGNIVSYALFHLTSAISKANTVLQSPSDASLSRYYDAQLSRAVFSINDELHKVRDIMNDTTISEKRKENSLRAQRDSISESLRESGFLKEFKSAFNHYDIDDYRKDNPEHRELSDDQVLEKLALSDLFDSNGEPHKIKIARHIFNHRKELSKEAIASFFVYVKVLPEIDLHLSQYAAQHSSQDRKQVTTADLAAALEASGIPQLNVYVEPGGVGVQLVGDGKTAKPQSTFKLEDKRGPKFQFLFVDTEGNEDAKHTKEEADRFKRYLQDYDLASVQLNSSKRNDVLKVIICFCKKWVGKGFTTTPISPTALTRFLIDICGIDKKVDRVSIANALLTMLNSGEYDKDIYSRVCEYF